MLECLAFIPTSKLQQEKAALSSPTIPISRSRLEDFAIKAGDDSTGWFEHTELGYNYRISDINCALGIEQLKRIDAVLNRRESIARKYDDILRSVSDLMIPGYGIAASQNQLVRLRGPTE